MSRVWQAIAKSLICEHMDNSYINAWSVRSEHSYVVSFVPLQIYTYTFIASRLLRLAYCTSHVANVPKTFNFYSKV